MVKRKTEMLSLETETIKRRLKVFDLFAIGYGDLGSSIYYALGITALYALGATPIALFLAGIVFVCTALTYAELSSSFKDSGGSASFARHAFNDLISFIAGWGLLLDYIVTIAISAFSVGPYLSYFFPLLKDPSYQIGFTSGIIILLLGINLIGVKESTRMSLVLMLFTLITQTVIVVIAGFTNFDFWTLVDNLKINSGGINSPTWPQFWKGTAMAMVAYTGIESIAQLGAETKKPQKNVPKAIILTMYVLVAMYLLLSSVALTSITPQELSTTYQEDPVAGIVSGLSWGKGVLGPWLGILAALLLFVAANAGLIGASRLSFNLGEYYQLPRFFYKLHPKFQTPYNALVIFAILSITIVIASRGQLSFLADLYNFGAMLAFTSAHVSLLALRYKHPEMARPFKVPLNITFRGRSYPITAIIGALSTISVFCLVVFTKPDGRNLGFAWMIVGTAIYLFYRKGQKLKAAGSLKIEKIKAPHFKPLAIKKIFVPIINNKNPDQIIDIAIDTALLHDSKIVCVDFEDIPFAAPIETQLVDFTNQKLRSWKAVSESKGVDFELFTYRSHHIFEDAVELAKRSQSDLVIASEIEKELVKKLRKKANVSVWVCY